eukprot:5322736-Alexandrium_andersonii.AAC.1
MRAVIASRPWRRALVEHSKQFTLPIPLHLLPDPSGSDPVHPGNPPSTLQSPVAEHLFNFQIKLTRDRSARAIDEATTWLRRR